jgi:hypothetical protein
MFETTMSRIQVPPDIESGSFRNVEYLSLLPTADTLWGSYCLRYPQKFQILNITRLQMVKVYKFKEKHADFFCRKSPSECQELLSQNSFTMLEDRDQNGRRLFLTKMGKLTDPTKWSSGDTHTHTQTSYSVGLRSLFIKVRICVFCL